MRSPGSFALEALECRLNLSAALPVGPGALSFLAAPYSLPVATPQLHYDSFPHAAPRSAPPVPAVTPAGTTPTTTPSPSPDAATQVFFDRFQSQPPTTPTPDPTPSPTPTPANTAPVTVTIRNMTSFNQLFIADTSGNDSIFVTQSGNTLTITANGTAQSVTGPFGELVVQSSTGDDSITIDSSVNIATLLYAGSGNDTILARGTGKTTIVTLDGGIANVTGNGLNTSYWVTPADTVHASAAEIAAGEVHTITQFYQPWSSDPTNPDYIPLLRNGQNFPDPTDSGTTIRLTNNSLWGTGPTMADVNQGYSADCYLLAALQSVANSAPAVLENLAVDLGDGTYAVAFTRNGIASYVRVDGDLPASNGALIYARTGPSGDLWMPILEKAYAFFRTGANTYASLGWGWTGAVMDDFGIPNQTISLTGNAAALFQTVSAALSSDCGIAVVTNSTIALGAPLVGSHAYSLVAMTPDPVAGYLVTLRNPWGFDGAGSDSNPSDGLVTMTIAQLQANVYWGSMMV